MRAVVLGAVACAGCVSEGAVLGDHGLPDLADRADTVLQVPEGAPAPDMVEVIGGRLVAYAAGTPTLWLDGCSLTFDAGIDVASAGDVDNDQREDLLISTPATCETSLIYGRDSLCGAVPDARFVLPCDVGTIARGVGDVDRDGFDDLLIAQPGDRARLYHGRPARFAGVLTEADADATFVPDERDTDFGFHVAPAGDTDGDGAADFFITVHGATLLFRGDPERFTGEVPPGRAAARLDDDAIGLHGPLGLGDLDGDERDDFALNGFAALYSLYYGRAGTYQAPEAALVGTDAGGHGTSIRAADLDGDGALDLAISDPQMLIDDRSVGGVHVLHAAGRRSGAVPLLEQAATWILDEDEALAGQPVPTSIATGDLDGDRIDDLAVAVPGVGRVYVVLGPLPRRE